MAYFGLEPWGEYRADLRSGIVASTIAQIFTKGRHRAESFVVVKPVNETTAARSDESIEAVFAGMAERGIGVWRKASSETSSSS